ncbi:MAG: hypothetical protein LBM77_01835 [Spirochaetaceae bacterium]|jgi:hypothetical protein|nr:hypothetical protein [Spirochaetaceae bacterium]
MEKRGQNNDILYAVTLIEEGRKLHFVEGTEAEGLRRFKDGSAFLKQAFLDAKATNDLAAILNAEYDFLAAEIAMGDPDETLAKGSAEAGLEVIEDALRALKALALGDAYKAVDLAYPRHDKRAWRYKDMPRDAFHVFCASHKSRLQNGLKRYGVSTIDRAFITLRVNTISAIEEAYCAMQRKALG